MSTLETTVTVEATLPSSGTKPQIRNTGPTSPGSGEIDGESLPNVAGKLENFSILRKLGSGAMGVVYAAYDEQLGRRVAIKLLRTQLGSQTSRFKREANGLARLNHPNVVQVHQLGTHDSRFFIVMEFVAGRTLRNWLEHGPHTRADILQVFMAAGRGLAAAHAANLVHRDFKPDNVMVGDDGQIKVMDFGLVQEKGSDLEALMSSHGSSSEEVEVATRRLDSALNLELTQPGALLGTPAYMAPEQHLGQPTDARADQFAFCVTLWEALYGRRPFQGDTWQELIDNVTGYELVEPDRNSDVPNWLRAVVERGLQTNPDERWPSMEELLEALDADPTRRRRWLIASAVSLGVVLGATFGYQAHAQNERETAAALALEQEREREARCTAEGDTIESAWNDERRAEVAAAMRAVDHPTSEEAWLQTESQFDEYAAAWARTRKQVCVEEDLEPARAEWAALARVCLEQRRQELTSMTALFAELDEPREILSSVLSAASLPEIVDCVDDSLLERNVTIPAANISDRVSDVRRQLAEVSAHFAIGRYKDALHKAEVAAEAAADIDWPPLSALTIYWRGQLRLRTDQTAEGRKDLEDAFFLGGEIGDPLAMLALGHLVFWNALHGNHEDALRWGRVGEMLVIRTDSDGSMPHAKLMVDIGTSYAFQGEQAQAIASFERALEIYSQLLPADHPELATILNNLGVAHQELERNAEALDYHHRALEIRRQMLPPKHPDIGYSQFGIGRVYAQQDQQDQAIAAFLEASNIWETALGADTGLVATAQLELGKIYETRSALEPARAAFARALTIREDPKSGARPSEVGEARFALARVTWEHEQERDHARALARDALAATPEANQTARDEIVAWIDAHGGPLEGPATPPSAP